MTLDTATVPAAVRADVEILWDFLRVDDEPGRADVVVGLGCHDPGVASFSAELYHRGVASLIVFTGANAPTTIARFPRGEAVHFREIALNAEVPDSAILVEPRAKHTAENIDFTKELLRGRQIREVLIVCRPYHQRRAKAAMRKRWPEVTARCASAPQTLHAYVASIGSAELVIDMLVGEVQRLTRYAETGHIAHQEIPAPVTDAYARLTKAGYTTRILP